MVYTSGAEFWVEFVLSKRLLKGVFNRTLPQASGMSTSKESSITGNEDVHSFPAEIYAIVWYARPLVCQRLRGTHVLECANGCVVRTCSSVPTAAWYARARVCGTHVLECANGSEEGIVLRRGAGEVGHEHAGLQHDLFVILSDTCG